MSASLGTIVNWRAARTYGRTMVRQLREVTLAEVRQHEAASDANIRLGGYTMDEYCPISEIRCFHVRLEAQDTERIFLLNDFGERTKDGSCRLIDLDETAGTIEKVRSLMNSAIDLRICSGLEIIAVCSDVERAAIVVADGNHRAIAQYGTYGSLAYIPAYICIHPKMDDWPHVPQKARELRVDEPGLR